MVQGYPTLGIFKFGIDAIGRSQHYRIVACFPAEHIALAQLVALEYRIVQGRELMLALGKNGAVQQAVGQLFRNTLVQSLPKPNLPVKNGQCHIQRQGVAIEVADVFFQLDIFDNGIVCAQSFEIAHIVAHQQALVNRWHTCFLVVLGLV